MNRHHNSHSKQLFTLNNCSLATYYMVSMSQNSTTVVQTAPVTASSLLFKKEASKAIFSIVLFIFVYVLLVALAGGLAALSVYLGVAIIIARPMWITLLLGAGLIGVGIMVFAFLIKFLFAKSGNIASDSTEITTTSQPALMKFIYQVSAETFTAKPKKVFISHDVNAAVFYQSSFWSLFLPVRKNLQIGLGLVNALNESEFKAVLAHEFGHFSQRSMKVGSYVYTVNYIIHNLLFNNSNYGNVLQSWAKLNGVFALFATLTAHIVNGIQWILRGMYKIVNKRYLGLSRQMEFHADLVSAKVSGANNMISALQKIELADACFNNTIDVCNKLWMSDKKVSNIYDCHQSILTYFHTNKAGASQKESSFQDVQHQQIVPRVSFKNQWASHPTTEERTDNLRALGSNASVNDLPAWDLFAEPEQLKQILTEKIYSHATAETEKCVTDTTEFEKVFSESRQEYNLPEVFKGYYDNRQIAVFPLEIPDETNVGPDNFNGLINEETAVLPKKIEATEQDIEVLNAIKNGHIDTKSFDFDGHKYGKGRAAGIKQQLETEQADLKYQLKVSDEQLYRFFYVQAARLHVDVATHLQQLYAGYFNYQKDAADFHTDINNLIEPLQPVFNGDTLSIEIINGKIESLKKHQEPNLKIWLVKWQKRGAFASDPALEKQVTDFLTKNYHYFSGTSFFENELIELNTIIRTAWFQVQIFLFETFKTIAVKQAEILKLISN